MSLQQALKNRKYRLLFSYKRRGKPGPRGPTKELIEVVVQMKQRNPTWGCPRIAQAIALAFDIPIDKDMVRRILARHYRPGQDSWGPSWLTFLGHLKDSLWSVDLFRCESATLRTHWVLVVMDQFTRRVMGFGVYAGTVDGVALYWMFNRVWKQLQNQEAEVFGIRPLETSPTGVEAAPSTEDVTEVIIPTPSPISEAVSQLLMFGSSLEQLPKRKGSRRATAATIPSSQLGLFQDIQTYMWILNSTYPRLVSAPAMVRWGLGPEA